MQKIHGWILQFQTGLEQLREKRNIAIKAFLVTLVIWINASIRFGLIVYAVTGNVEAAGLIILASGLVYSIGTFLPFGVGNIAIATLVLSAADIDEAQAITIGIVEVATSLTLSVPMGILSMGITGMPEELRIGWFTRGLTRSRRYLRQHPDGLCAGVVRLVGGRLRHRNCALGGGPGHLHGVGLCRRSVLTGLLHCHLPLGVHSHVLRPLACQSPLTFRSASWQGAVVATLVPCSSKPSTSSATSACRPAGSTAANAVLLIEMPRA